MGLNYCNKKLLDKYNLSLSCLDYGYIGNSTNVKELENILKILRSGEEGFFPDLIKFCECQLNKVSPDNELLQEAKQVSSFQDLPHEDQALLLNDINNWVEDIKLQDKELLAAPTRVGFESDCPIRNVRETNVKTEEKKMVKSQKGSSQTKSKTLSYEDWNKFDAEKEIEKLDQEKVTHENVKDSMAQMYDNEPLLPVVDVSGLSDNARMALADQEKMKGNEYFKARNYVDSLIYYSRSLSAFRTIAALNNRAFAYMKLKNYTSAVLDFGEVLDLEPDNVKALYRRGLCYKETGSMQLAFMDFLNAVELNPSCKEAKKELEEMDKCPVLKTSSTRKSLVIEEVHDSPSDLLTMKRKIALDSELELKAKKTIYYNKKDTSVHVAPDIIKADGASNHSKIGSKSKDSNLKGTKVPSVDKKNDTIQEDTEEQKCRDNLNQASGDTSHDSKISKSNNIGLEKCDDKNSNVLPFPTQMTPFKFLNLWYTCKASKNGKAGAEILNSISPDKLPSYITNKLDANILNGLIMAVKEIVNSGDWLKGYEFMKHIVNIPRIKIVSSFLSSYERKEIEDIFLQIEAKQKTEIMAIRESLLF